MLAWWLVVASLLAPLVASILALRRGLIAARPACAHVPFALLLGLGLGYGVFSLVVSRFEGGIPPVAVDGIIALSGRMERLHAAIDLLAQGVAPAALLSGTQEGASDVQLARLRDRDPELFDRAVTLGPSARNTAGNAQEAVAWVGERGMKRILVISTDLHLPRAMLLLRRALQDEIELQALAVPPMAHTDGGWVAAPITWRERLTEFLKFLLAPLSSAQAAGRLSAMALGTGTSRSSSIWA
jgi:uncharacterized SAM-binding protein YcdF (DUF218 family)